MCTMTTFHRTRSSGYFYFRRINTSARGRKGGLERWRRRRRSWFPKIGCRTDCQRRARETFIEKTFVTFLSVTTDHSKVPGCLFNTLNATPRQIQYTCVKNWTMTLRSRERIVIEYCFYFIYIECNNAIIIFMGFIKTIWANINII